MSNFDVNNCILWAATRQTKREEDAAYSLLGIFNIHMPLIYGEGQEKALIRLRKEIEQSLENKSPALPLARSTEQSKLNRELFSTVLFNEEQKRMLMDSLRFDQINSRQITIKNAYTKTCKWLLKNSAYMDWLNASKLSQYYGFLWIKGKPRTGKSILVKFALVNTRKLIKNKLVILFFFNARGEGLENLIIGIY